VGTRRFVFALAIGIAACGSDDAPPLDGGGADGSADAAGSYAPVPPFPPMMPCPAGWTERISATSVVTCDPWPGSGREDCTGAEAHFPGRPGCERVGSACPSDGIPTDLPAGATVIHVRAGATSGDGSAGTPFGSITEAMSRANSGAIIAVGPGTYDEAPTIRAGVTVWGACVDEVTWTSSSAVTNRGVATPGGAGVVVRNLRIAGAARPAGFVGTGDLTFEDVVVEDVAFAGVVAMQPGRLEATRLVVRDTRSIASGAGGAALVVLDTSVTIHIAAFERNRDIGVVADGLSSVVVLEDAVIRDNEARDGTRTNGRGIEMASGTLELRRVALEGNREYGALVWSNGRALFEDVVVRDGRVRLSDDTLGLGIVVASGGSLEGRRVLLERNRGIELFVTGGTAVVEDAVLRETFADAPTGYFGRALGVQDTGDVTLRRAVLETNRDIGIFAGGEVTVQAEDLVVRDNAGTDTGGLFGRGVEATLGASLTIERALIERARDLAAVTFGGTLELTDVEVRDTLAQACSPECTAGGIGIGGYDRGIVRARQFRISGSTLCGVHVAQNGAVELSQGEITGNPIGACVQVDGYDLDRLNDEVQYRDNGVNLDSTTLPVPTASTSLGP
jgi:hypothetical protein